LDKAEHEHAKGAADIQTEVKALENRAWIEDGGWEKGEGAAAVGAGGHPRDVVQRERYRPLSPATLGREDREERQLYRSRIEREQRLLDQLRNGISD